MNNLSDDINGWDDVIKCLISVRSRFGLASPYPQHPVHYYVIYLFYDKYTISFIYTKSNVGFNLKNSFINYK